MKIAHMAIVSPRRNGLYETVRDLVEAERTLGMDARIVNPEKDSPSAEDRGTPIADAQFAKHVDVVVNHSGMGIYEDLDKPIIHVMHGRPRSSFLLEITGKSKVYSALFSRRSDPKYRVFVTLWEEYLAHWRVILPPEKIKYIPPPVNLSEWTPSGPRGYGFHGKGGTINVVCSDPWRLDKDPYEVINAFAIFAESHPGAKFHLYGADKTRTKKAWLVLFSALNMRGGLGEVHGWVKGLDNVYRAADILVTPHRIATRSVRESLACGCSVVMGRNGYTPYHADPADPIAFADAMHKATENRRFDADHERRLARHSAEQHFDAKRTAEAFIKLSQEVLNGSL